MITNSRGSIAARFGMSLKEMGEHDRAMGQFEEAEMLFRKARTGERVTNYPYYGEAQLLLRRSEGEEVEDRIKLLANALQVVDESEENDASEGTAAMAEIESRILRSVSSISRFDELVHERSEEGDLSAIYLKARLAVPLYSEGSSGSVSQALLLESYQTLQKALAKDPNHIPCLRLMSRVYLSINEEDWQGWKSILTRRLSVEPLEGNHSLLFDLGRASLQLDQNREAISYFSDLESQSQGHPKRAGIREVVSDKGKPRRYFGHVRSTPSRYEGWISSMDFSIDIRFTPTMQKFTVSSGQLVNFEVAMNYRGIFAVELRPE